MANTYLERTFGSAGNRKTFTISTWLKRNQLGGGQSIFHGEISGSTNGEQDDFYFGSDFLVFGGWISNYITSTAKFRDTSAWYHIVLAVDTTQATSSNRIKLYVNGVEQARSEGTGYPAQNFDTAFIKAGTFRIAGNSGASGYGNYTLSHFHFIDGTAYDATAFGETDATTGEWKGKTSPSVTYGTNGFFILKDGNGITDQSGEGNDFTLGGGTLTDLKDNPDNNFATWNSLNQQSSISYTNGNNTFVNSSSANRMAFSNFGVSQGKYYAELKVGVVSNYMRLGIADISYYIPVTNAYSTNLPNSISYANDNPIYIGSSSQGNFDSFTTNDIISIAMDMDNGFAYLGKNGTWLNSGNPTSGATGTGGFAIPNYTTKTYCFLGSSFDGGTDNTVSANFGNGYFGTTAITTNSGNGYAGAEGSSKFNYTVPTGYSALSTKGLNE